MSKPETPPDPRAQVQVHARTHVHAREASGNSQLPALQAVPGAPSVGHNSVSIESAVATLTSAIERQEKLDAEIARLNRQKSDTIAELKAQGFDVAAFRRVMKERRVDPLLRAEREQIFAVYWNALGRAAPEAKSEDGEVAA